MTNYDSLVYYKVQWTVPENFDRFVTTCDTVYYKLRQVLQSAMVIRTMIANVHAYYYTI